MLSDIERAKIGLMTRGMKVTDEARRAIEGDSRRPLTLADYASTSGISMAIGSEGRVYVNAPISDHNANFVSDDAPYTLDVSGSDFYIRSDSGDEFKARPILVPAYHDQVTSEGDALTDYAITHTDRVRISPIQGCSITCDFCDLPAMTYRRKDHGGLVESIDAALRDPVQPAHHVLISGGTPKKGDYDAQNELYATVARAFPGVDVDIMMVPMPGLLDPQGLRDVGIKGLSINLELWNADRRKALMRGKGKLTRDAYLDFIAGAVPLFGEGNVRSLLMVGIEPMEDTLTAVDELSKRGAEAVLSPFRPDPATPLKDESPPSEELLSETYQRARDIAEGHGVKLGPRCIPCHHNTLTFPDDSGAYHFSEKDEGSSEH